MENKILKLPIGIEGAWSVKQWSEFCKRFDCTLLPKKRGSAEWTITSDNASNFFWLGVNLNFKVNTSQMISTSSYIDEIGKK